MKRIQRAARPAPGHKFLERFPQRLERLREASGLTWRMFAAALGVNVRSVHRWRRGAKPDGSHLLALFKFALERELLDCLLPDRGREPLDKRQAVLFAEDEWARLSADGAELRAGRDDAGP